MKKSEILQQARGILARGVRHNICHALSGVVCLTPGALHQCLELRKWIKDMLGGCEYYEVWVKKHHPEFIKQLDLTDHHIGHIQYLQGRLDWMDWMIQSWQQWEAEDAQQGKGMA